MFPIHIQEMLLDRGFSDAWERTEFSGLPGKHCIHAQHRVHVFITNKENLRIRNVRLLLSTVLAQAIPHSIVIVQHASQCTSKARATLEPYLYRRSPDWFLELFDMSFFRINVTRHVLVPQHVQLTDDALNHVLAQLFHSTDRSVLAQFPRILTTDPVAKYYAFEPGSVIQIHRASGEKYYRLCCLP